MVNKRILSIFILLMFTLNIFAINYNVNSLPYKTTNYKSTYVISASADDAYYLIGYQFSNNSTLGYLKSSLYDTYTGLRFDGATIPVGATIDHAYISLYGSDAVDANSYLSTIYGIDADDYGAFTNSGTLTGATVTTAYSNWDMNNLEGGAWRNTTNLKSVVQEIVSRGGWVSGNALAFRLSSAISAHGSRSFRTYDYTGATYDPKIYVAYHTSTVISNSNPWDSISGWDNHEIVNDTLGYTWWEVWNGTTYTIVNFFDGNYAHGGWLWIDSGDTKVVLEEHTQSGSNTVRGNPYMVTLGDTIYCLGNIYAMPGTYKLYKSINNGVSWSLCKSLSDGGGYRSMATDGIDTIIIISIPNAGTTVTLWKYVKSTNALTSKTVTSGGSNQFPGGVVYNSVKNTFIIPWTDSSNIGYFKYYMANDTISSYKGVHVSSTQHHYWVSCVANKDNDLFYWMYITYDTEITGFLMQSDYSCSAIEQVAPVAIKATWQFDFAFDDNNHVGVTYIKDSNGYVYFKERVASWGSESAVRSITSKSVGMVFGGDFGDSYDIIVMDTTDTRDKYIYSSLNPWNVVKQYLDMGNGTIGVDLYNFDGEDTHYSILTDPNGNIIPSGDMPDYIIYQPDYLNSTYDGLMFESEVYKIGIFVNNTDITYLTLNDTVHTLTFSYNNNTDIYKLEVTNADGTLINQLVAGLISSGKNDYNGNITYVWWKFILNTNIVDCTDRNIKYTLDYTLSVSPYTILLTDSGWINANITIYNLGGLIEYEFFGDGGHVTGGHPFELYATNSTLNSSARADIIYRRLQGIHLLVELDTDNKLDGGSEKFQQLSDVGYYEAGIDYKMEGNETDPWIEGWMVRVYIDEIMVGTNALLSDNAYVRLRIYWYNRGSVVRGDEHIYSYHFGYDKDAFPSPRTSFTFWCDLWFDKSNSSTVFGGRVNPQYYGYYEAGSAWWFNSKFRPQINNVTSSMIFDDIRDADGNIISSKEISLVKVHSSVVKTADGGDADTYTIKPHQVMKMQLAKERMNGIDTPDFIETQQLDIAGYGMYNILGGIGTAITSALFGVIRLMIGGIDTFLSYFGLPYGTFSTLMNYISVSFSSLMSWLTSLTLVFGNMLAIFSSLVTNISNLITYVISAILFFLTDIFTIPLQVIQLVVAVLNGTSITFYGIPLDFTPYKDLMDALKQILPTFGSMMFATWLLYGNITFEGEPDVGGFMSRVKLSFEWIRDTYTGIFWIFNAIYSEILFIYAWVKSHIPTLGGTPSSGSDLH